MAWVDPDAGKRVVYPAWEYDSNADDAERNLVRDHFPDFAPRFSNVYLDRCTDALNDSSNIGGMGFMLSEQAKAAFEPLDLGPHRWYPLDAFDHDTKEAADKTYHWLQLIDDGSADHIDFERSAFYLSPLYPLSKIRDLVIETPEQLQDAIAGLIGTDHAIVYTSLFLHETFGQPDLFFLDWLATGKFAPHQRVIASTRFKQVVEMNNLTGFRFDAAPIVVAHS